MTMAPSTMRQSTTNTKPDPTKEFRAPSQIEERADGSQLKVNELKDFAKFNSELTVSSVTNTVCRNLSACVIL